MPDMQYKLERVAAGHFILDVYGTPLDNAVQLQIRQCGGVTNITPPQPPLRKEQPGTVHVIDVSRETITSDRVAGRVRGRILRVLNAYYSELHE